MVQSLVWMFVCQEQNEIVMIQDKLLLSVKLIEFGQWTQSSEQVMVLLMTTNVPHNIDVNLSELFWDCSCVQMTTKLKVDYKSSF